LTALQRQADVELIEQDQEATARGLLPALTVTMYWSGIGVPLAATTGRRPGVGSAASVDTTERPPNARTKSSAMANRFMVVTDPIPSPNG
jgi:hypothetical protein